MLLKRFTVSNLIFALCLSCPVFAENLKVENETKEEDDIYLDETTNSLCLPLTMAQDLLKLKITHGLIEEKNVLLEGRLEIKDAQLLEMEKIVSNSGAQVLTLSGVLEKLETSPKWYNNKIFWFVTGAILGTAATTTIFLLR
jgi:hypothetical protein